MKKLLFLSLICLKFSITPGQSVPNGGFEETYRDSWGNILPQHWTPNFWGLIIDSTHHPSKPHYPYSGMYAQVILNRADNGPGYKNIVGLLSNKFSLTSYPKSVSGYFFYDPTNQGETFLMKVILFKRKDAKSPVDTIGIGYAHRPNAFKAQTWIKSECDINYFRSERPDSAEIIIYASSPDNYSPTTTLIVDDVEISDTLESLSVNTLIPLDRGTICEVYPNPATDRINFRFKSPDLQTYRIMLFDIIGREITTHTTISDGTTDFSLPASSFADGTYFVRVETENHQRETYKIVILK